MIDSCELEYNVDDYRVVDPGEDLDVTIDLPGGMEVTGACSVDFGAVVVSGREVDWYRVDDETIALCIFDRSGDVTYRVEYLTDDDAIAFYLCKKFAEYNGLGMVMSA